ncbi:hypothetical protein D3C73_1466830 [compost metagenome]
MTDQREEIRLEGTAKVIFARIDVQVSKAVLNEVLRNVIIMYVLAGEAHRRLPVTDNERFKGGPASRSKLLDLFLFRVHVRAFRPPFLPGCPLLFAAAAQIVTL